MALLDNIKRLERRAETAATIAADDMLRGRQHDALTQAMAAQRYRCEAREYSDVLAICADTRR